MTERLFTIVVTGSRMWTDEEKIRAVLMRLTREHGRMRVVHGAAFGADEYAARIAAALGHEVIAEPANWDVTDETLPENIKVRKRDGRRYDRTAGFQRNIYMLEHHEPDLVVAFWRGGSAGTMHCVRQAEGRHIPVDVTVVKVRA